MSTHESPTTADTKRRRRRWAAGAVGLLAAGSAFVIGPGTPAGASRELATATLRNADGQRVGQVVFLGRHHHADTVLVRLRLPAEAPALGSFHGIHVHTTGQCAAPFTSAGGHWNLDGAIHGQHTGDLPSALVGPDGTAELAFATHRFDVRQLADADGSAVVLHAGADNFGNVPLGGGKYEDPNGWYTSVDPAGTARTGDAGGRYACGVVSLL